MIYAFCTQMVSDSDEDKHLMQVRSTACSINKLLKVAYFLQGLQPSWYIKGNFTCQLIKHDISAHPPPPFPIAIE